MKKLQKYIERSESVITGKKNLEHLYTFKDFPIFMGCVETSAEEDIVADMVWDICPDTGVVQLSKLIPLEILYQSQHVDGCGPTWQKYYEAFADYVAAQNSKSILEIGGGQGMLAQLTTSKSSDLVWTIIEPNPPFGGNERIKIIPSFFDENFKYSKKVDAVVFSQLLEHIYEPRKFLDNIAKFLKPGGLLIFAYPQLKLWLEKKYTNSINFEHTMFLTDYHLDYLLPQYGFEVVNKREYEEHGFFYTCKRTEEKLQTPNFENKYNEYKKIFMDFIDYHKVMVGEINKKIETAKEPIYLFGAHIFSQSLIGFGLKTDKIVSVLDNSPTKRGKRLYGTRFKVESPKILKDKGEVNIILKAGVYNQEIKKDILENINDRVVFW